MKKITVSHLATVCGGLILAVSIAGITGLEIPNSRDMTIYTLLTFSMGVLVGWLCTSLHYKEMVSAKGQAEASQSKSK